DVDGNFLESEDVGRSNIEACNKRQKIDEGKKLDVDGPCWDLITPSEDKRLSVGTDIHCTAEDHVEVVVDTIPIEFGEENHENNHENQQSDHENHGRDHTSNPVNNANIPMLEKHVKFLETNLNANLDKILENQMWASGYGDAPVQFGGICFPSPAVEVISRKKRRSVGGRHKKETYTSQEMGDKSQILEQSALCDLGDSTGFANITKQNNVGGDTIEPIDVVPIACIGDTVPNNDKQQDIDISTSEDITRRLSYEERPEEGVDKEVADPVTSVEEQHLVIPKAQTQSYIVKSVQEVNYEDPESATPLEEEHQVFPEAQTQFELAKYV
ncbi:hypothetical protein HAX54_021057, partial [Datura stramonium]|nr:hypothetical protein [Datura stramonium]